MYVPEGRRCRVHGRLQKCVVVRVFVRLQSKIRNISRIMFIASGKSLGNTFRIIVVLYNKHYVNYLTFFA